MLATYAIPEIMHVRNIPHVNHRNTASAAHIINNKNN